MSRCCQAVAKIVPIASDLSRDWPDTALEGEGVGSKIGEGVAGATRAVDMGIVLLSSSIGWEGAFRGSRSTHHLLTSLHACDASGDYQGYGPKLTTGERPARQKQRHAGRLRDRSYDFLVLSALGLGFFGILVAHVNLLAFYADTPHALWQPHPDA